MTSRFISPFYDIGSGIKPPSGAQLFFFEDDGVTPKDTYTTKTATVANTNPVIADSVGVFPAIYIKASYLVTLKDKNDSQIYGLAPIEENSGASDLSLSYEFPTVAAFKASLIEFPDGKTIRLLDRGADFTKISGNTPTLDLDVIFSTNVSQSIELIVDDHVNVSWLGTDALAMQRAHELSLHVVYQSGVTYDYDPTLLPTPGIVGQEGQIVDYKGSLIVLTGKSYIVDVKLIGISYGINFPDDANRYQGMTLNDLTFDGNSQNVTMAVNKSSNCIWAYKMDGMITNNCRIKNMPTGNGGLPAVIYRYCNDFESNNLRTYKDIGVLYSTDRQSVLSLESTGAIIGGRLGNSKIREPLLITSDDGQEYQPSNVSVTGVNLNNKGTDSGSRIIRFSGASNGSVVGCRLVSDLVNTGSSAIVAALYLGSMPTADISAVNNSVVFSDNIIEQAGAAVEYGNYSAPVPKWKLTLSNNDFKNLTRGYNLAKGTPSEELKFTNNTLNVTEYGFKASDNGTIKIMGDTFIGGTDFSEATDYEHFEMSNVLFKGNTNAGQTCRVGLKAAGGNNPIITGTTVSDSTQNKIQAGSGVLVISAANNFFTSGFFAMTQDGFNYYWINGSMYLKGGEPTSNTDGTIVGP